MSSGESSRVRREHTRKPDFRTGRSETKCSMHAGRGPAAGVRSSIRVHLPVIKNSDPGTKGEFRLEKTQRSCGFGRSSYVGLHQWVSFG